MICSWVPSGNMYKQNVRFQFHCIGNGELKDCEGVILGSETVNFQLKEFIQNVDYISGIQCGGDNSSE